MAKSINAIGDYEFKIMHLYAGMGGGGLGFKHARYGYKGIAGKFRNILGIDVDENACKDYERLTGSPAKVMDLFSRDQYTAFHGFSPPDDWKEITPEEILTAAGGEYPDVVFSSPPCKGLSALLSQKSADSAKYQALNRLVVRGISLTLEAFRKNLPSLILLENVPRIKTRGKALLAEIKALLSESGYVFHEGFHDCGEYGGLGQHRKRFLLIARLPEKLPVFIYRPFKKRVKSIGEIIGPLPMPDDASMGAMHRLPALKWNTWVRLALIPPGGDWRDLEEKLSYSPRGAGAFGVQEWKEPSAAVIGNSKVNGSNASCVADPRRWKANRHVSHFKIVPYDEPSGTVTGADHVANGMICIADVRLKNSNKRHPNVYQIVKWDETSPCVTGTRFGSGAIAIADMRVGCSLRAGSYGVQDISKPSVTVSGSLDIHQGAAAVADPKIPADNKTPVIISLWGFWHRPLTTLELAALQGFPTIMEDGSPLILEGKSQAKWRERIGNAVPPPAAEAIGEFILQSLVANRCGELLLNLTEVWVDKNKKGDGKGISISLIPNVNSHTLIIPRGL